MVPFLPCLSRNAFVDSAKVCEKLSWTPRSPAALRTVNSRKIKWHKSQGLQAAVFPCGVVADIRELYQNVNKLQVQAQIEYLRGVAGSKVARVGYEDARVTCMTQSRKRLARAFQQRRKCKHRLISSSMLGIHAATSARGVRGTSTRIRVHSRLRKTPWRRSRHGPL